MLKWMRAFENMYSFMLVPVLENTEYLSEYVYSETRTCVKIYPLNWAKKIEMPLFDISTYTIW